MSQNYPDIIMKTFDKISRNMIGYLNSSSLRNGFDLLGKLTKGIKDMLIISETKLDASFLDGLFHIEVILRLSEVK